MTTAQRQALESIEQERREAWGVYLVAFRKYDRERRELLRQIDECNKEHYQESPLQHSP